MNPPDAAPRRGDWIQTATGRQYWPLDPRPEDVEIVDIARALSKLCRFGGHSVVFYSVAEHCVHIARWLLAQGESPQVALWGLLHDAAEAYVVDVPRPLKAHLPSYAEIEAANMAAICTHFGLPPEMPERVKEADTRILVDEQREIMAPSPAPWNGTQDSLPLGISLQGWSSVGAEMCYLALFGALSSAAHEGLSSVSPSLIDDWKSRTFHARWAERSRNGGGAPC